MSTDVAPAEWLALDDETRENLLAWRNIREPDADDLRRLAELHAAGAFRAWACPCGEMVYEATPDDWGHFQGAHQNDRVSYPGSGPRDKRCDHCRCHNK